MVILPFIHVFLQRSPGISIEVSFNDRIVDLIEEGFDLAIRVGNGVTSHQYITQVIDRAYSQLCVSPDYLKQWGKPESFADLKDHRRLVFGLGSASTAWTLVDKDNGKITLNGRNYVRFDSGDAIRTAALAGLGVAYLPSFMIDGDILSGHLVQLLAKTRGEGIAIHAIYPNRRHLSIRVRTFIDCLKNFLSNP